MSTKAARKFRAEVEALDSRQVPGSVHYHLVDVVGRGVAYQTSSIAQTGGGFQVVDILAGRASDLGSFKGAITYKVGPNGGTVSGMGAIHTVHQYLFTFVLSGKVLKTPGATTADAFLFNVTGGTKRFELATGQGLILVPNASKPAHSAFRITGLFEQAK